MSETPAEKKPQVLHVKKLDGGRRSADEMFRELAIAHKCSTCESPAAMKAHFLAPLDEFKHRHPDLYRLAMLQHGGDPSFETIHGRMVRIETAYACDRCKPALKHYAAKKGDWILVHFEEGPDPTNKIVTQSAGIPGET